jgi:transcriptional regulator with GAF, ATPase, and Fis domain
MTAASNPTEHLQRMIKLFAVTSELHRTLDLGAVFRAILETLNQVVGAQSSLVMLLEETQGLYMEQSQIPTAQDPAFHTARARYASTIDAVTASGTPFVRHAEGAEDAPLACYPFTIDGQTIGLMLLTELLPQKVALDTGDFELLDLLAQQAAVALTGARLYTASRQRLEQLHARLAASLQPAPEVAQTPPVALAKLTAQYGLLLQSYLAGQVTSQNEAMHDLCHALVTGGVSPKAIVELHLQAVEQMVHGISHKEEHEKTKAARMLLLKVVFGYASLYREQCQVLGGNGPAVPDGVHLRQILGEAAQEIQRLEQSLKG